MIVVLAAACHGDHAASHHASRRAAIAVPGDVVDRVVLSGALQPTAAIGSRLRRPTSAR